MLAEVILMKTILVAVDFSDVTDRLLSEAGALATALRSRVVFLHVRAPEVMVSSMMGEQIPLTPTTMPPILLPAEQCENVQPQLDQLKDRFTDFSNDIVTKQIEGMSVDVILEESEKERADMIIIGSHGHGALYNLLVGSVTSGVLKLAKCPVLVVPSPGR